MLIAVLEEYEDSDITQKDDVNYKKTPAKMLPSTHCVCTIFVVNAGIVKVKNKNISG